MASLRRRQQRRNNLFLALLLLLIVSIAPNLVLSFAGSHVMFGVGRRVNVNVEKKVEEQQQVRLPRLSEKTRRSTTQLFFSAKDDPDNQTRNMFQSGVYAKPIVLLGASGPGQELLRLAESLMRQLDLDVDASKGPIQRIDSIQNLITNIEENKVKFPQVIVLDFGSSDFSADKDDLVEQYSATAKALYEAGLLSIYVNVHPEDSGMEDATASLKSQLEEPIFVSYTDYELCIREEGRDAANNSQETDDWSHVEWELCRLVARAMLLPAIPGDTTRTANTAHLTMGAHTFFLSLSFPDIRQVEPYVEEMCGDVDAMEYRTDLLDCRDSRFDLIYGQQLLRKYCRPHATRVPGLPLAGRGQVMDDVMPIVYTVRTQHQAGTYPDDEKGISKMFDLLEWGLRSGVEVLDVESAWSPTKTSELLALAKARYSTQILGSHHVVGEEVTLEDAVMLFQQCALNGRAHGAKVVLSITDDERDRMAYEAALIASALAEQDGDPVIPNISLILGEVGKFSRVINIPFTPVTHESLPFEAAPGQMTSSEIMTTRLLTKILESKKYAILGHNIAYSVSPQMQGAAFAAVRLPHEYGRADVETIEEFVASDFFQASSFGGCSVTIPHKQSIIPHVNVLSDAAKTIGSVNTLVVKEEVGEDEFERVIYGENTDWRGIYNPLERKLGKTKQGDCALILGAGGTARAAAYAAEKLGLERLYFNRTPQKAAELADTFGGTAVVSLEEGGLDDKNSLGNILAKSNGAVRVVISTLPAAANFELPEWMLSADDSSGRSLPIVFDVNYKPYNTRLLVQAESCGCDVVRGSEMLWEQGVGQFELWTERTAPYRVMKQVVLENCLPPEKETVDTSSSKTVKTTDAALEVQVATQD